MMIDKEKVVGIIRAKGPILPVQLVKEIGGNTMIAGAILSDLVKSRRVMISKAKIGSSPIYYVNGQEQKLSILYDSLHEKEKQAYDLLKKESVLKDTELASVERVALRQIKDFAVPLEVNLPQGKEIFWRWYLLPKSQAEEKIKDMLGIKDKRTEDENKEKEQMEIQRKNVEEIRLKNEGLQKELLEQKKLYAQKEKEREQNKNREQDKRDSKNIKDSKEDHIKTEAIVELSRPQEKQGKLIKDETDGKDRKDEQLPTREQRTELLKDDFFGNISDDFKKRNIRISDVNIIRKNSDIEMILTVPSAIGTVDMFCKARNKKKNNDGDLSSAFLQGQLKKLPTIYLTTGEITKKAMEKINKELRGIIVIRI